MTAEGSPPSEGASERAPAQGNSLAQWSLLVASFVPVILVTCLAFFYRDWLEEARSIGYAGIFAANALSSATFILPAPGIATVIIGATALHPLAVGVAGGTGSTIGEIVVYLAGVGSHGPIQRSVGRSRWYGRVSSWVERRGAVTIFLLAATPTPFFDVAGFAAGSLRYPIARFLIACWLGKIVKFCAVAYAAHWGASVVREVFEGWLA